MAKNEAKTSSRLAVQALAIIVVALAGALYVGKPILDGGNAVPNENGMAGLAVVKTELNAVEADVAEIRIDVGELEDEAKAHEQRFVRHEAIIGHPVMVERVDALRDDIEKLGRDQDTRWGEVKQRWEKDDERWRELLAEVRKTN